MFGYVNKVSRVLKMHERLPHRENKLCYYKLTFNFMKVKHEHNITHRFWSLEHNNQMLGALSKSKSPYTTFQAFDCYIPRAR